MITPAEIEAVARAACKEMGLDADERGGFTSAQGPSFHEELTAMRWVATSMPGSMPAWRYFVRDAEAVIAFHRAIEAVKGAGK